MPYLQNWGPFVNNVGFQLPHVDAGVQAMLHQSRAGRNFMASGRMIAGADNDQDLCIRLRRLSPGTEWEETENAQCQNCL